MGGEEIERDGGEERERVKRGAASEENEMMMPK